MKVLLIIGGSLAALFTLAQLLQLLLGSFGVISTIAGIGLTALGLAATIACFKKAFKNERRRRRHRS
jgi:hypothetical protein